MLELWVVTADDWQAWRELRLAALRDAPYAFSSTLSDWEDATEQRWRARLTAGGGHNSIALLDGERAGMVTGMPGAAQTAELLGMWVAPNARRCGVGAALLDGVQTWAKKSGKRSVRLEVRRDNHAAFELYRRHGFRATTRDVATESNEPIEMLLSLEGAAQR